MAARIVNRGRVRAIHADGGGAHSAGNPRVAPTEFRLDARRVVVTSTDRDVIVVRFASRRGAASSRLDFTRS
jgi:hypothetical protein